MATLLRRFRLILCRWISLVCCGIIAAIVVAVVNPLLQRIFASVIDRLSTFTPTAITVTLAVLLGTACWFVGQGRWRGFVGVRFFFSYPPLWVAVLIALGLLLGVRMWFDGIGSVKSLVQELGWFGKEVPILIWIALLLFAGGVVVVPLWPDLVTALRRFWDGDSRHFDTKHGQTAGDFTALCDWLRDDSPVDTPVRDLFHHNDIARRMAERLCQKDGAPTMALIGRLGSGKSTIGKLVDYHLQNKLNVRLIRVSLWPFDSAEAAVRGILQAIIGELGLQVNILPIVGLSEDYIAVIERTAGAYGGIARMFRGTSDPKKILRQLSKVACAAGLRLVLWIEDLERFSGGGQLEDGAHNEREVERLGPIRSFLYLLDLCGEVSVVVADTSLQTRFDISKIARFVEQVPRMEVEMVWQFTNLIRTQCLNGYPVAVIDPTAPQVREDFAPKQNLGRFREWLSAFSDRDTSGVFEAIVQVLKTPRALKGTLRRTLEIWETMPGEIDFDAVLVANALREAYPDLFALVSDHIYLFCYGLRDPISHGEQAGKPHEVVDRIDELLKRESQRESQGTAAALRKMLHFLFPKYPSSEDHEEKEYVLRPQAMFVDSHANYWQRYQTQTHVSEAESDQRALASIAAWRSGKANNLLDRIVSPQCSGQIKSFVNQLVPSDLCRLLREVADRVGTQSAAEWEHRSQAPGITAVWEMMHIKRPQEELVHHTVMEIVKRNAPIHLPLAHDIVCIFATSNPRVSHVMSDVQEKEVRHQLRDSLAVNFTGEGTEQRLADALKDGSPWLMRRIAYGDSDDRTAPPFDRWTEFSSVLLTLAESQPAIGVPLVVGLITKIDMKFSPLRGPTGEDEMEGGWVSSFDAEAAKRLFDYARLVRILSTFEVPDHLDEQMKASCFAAVDAARTEVSLS